MAGLNIPKGSSGIPIQRSNAREVPSGSDPKKGAGRVKSVVIADGDPPKAKSDLVSKNTVLRNETLRGRAKSPVQQRIETRVRQRLYKAFTDPKSLGGVFSAGDPLHSKEPSWIIIGEIFRLRSEFNGEEGKKLINAALQKIDKSLTVDKLIDQSPHLDNLQKVHARARWNSNDGTLSTAYKLYFYAKGWEKIGWGGVFTGAGTAASLKQLIEEKVTPRTIRKINNELRSFRAFDPGADFPIKSNPVDHLIREEYGIDLFGTEWGAADRKALLTYIKLPRNNRSIPYTSYKMVYRLASATPQKFVTEFAKLSPSQIKMLRKAFQKVRPHLEGNPLSFYDLALGKLQGSRDNQLWQAFKILNGGEAQFKINAQGLSEEVGPEPLGLLTDKQEGKQIDAKRQKIAKFVAHALWSGMVHDGAGRWNHDEDRMDFVIKNYMGAGKGLKPSWAEVKKAAQGIKSIPNNFGSQIVPTMNDWFAALSRVQGLRAKAVLEHGFGPFGAKGLKFQLDNTNSRRQIADILERLTPAQLEAVNRLDTSGKTRAHIIALSGVGKTHLRSAVLPSYALALYDQGAKANRLRTNKAMATFLAKKAQQNHKLYPKGLLPTATGAMDGVLYNSKTGALTRVARAYYHSTENYGYGFPRSIDGPKVLEVLRGLSLEERGQPFTQAFHLLEMLGDPKGAKSVEQRFAATLDPTEQRQAKRSVTGLRVAGLKQQNRTVADLLASAQAEIEHGSFSSLRRIADGNERGVLKQAKLEYSIGLRELLVKVRDQRGPNAKLNAQELQQIAKLTTDFVLSIESYITKREEIGDEATDLAIFAASMMLPFAGTIGIKALAVAFQATRLRRAIPALEKMGNWVARNPVKTAVGSGAAVGALMKNDDGTGAVIEKGFTGAFVGLTAGWGKVLNNRRVTGLVERGAGSFRIAGESILFEGVIFATIYMQLQLGSSKFRSELVKDPETALKNLAKSTGISFAIGSSLATLAKIGGRMMKPGADRRAVARALNQEAFRLTLREALPAGKQAQKIVVFHPTLGLKVFDKLGSDATKKALKELGINPAKAQKNPVVVIDHLNRVGYHTAKMGRKIADASQTLPAGLVKELEKILVDMAKKAGSKPTAVQENQIHVALDVLKRAGVKNLSPETHRALAKVFGGKKEGPAGYMTLAKKGKPPVGTGEPIITTDRSFEYVIEQLAGLNKLRRELGLPELNFKDVKKLASQSWLSLGEGDSNFLKTLIEAKPSGSKAQHYAVDLVYKTGQKVSTAQTGKQWAETNGFSNVNPKSPHYVGASYEGFTLPGKKFRNMVCIHSMEFGRIPDPAQFNRLFENLAKHAYRGESALMIAPALPNMPVYQKLLDNLLEKGIISGWKRGVTGIVVKF